MNKKLSTALKGVGTFVHALAEIHIAAERLTLIRNGHCPSCLRATDAGGIGTLTDHIGQRWHLVCYLTDQFTDN